MRFCCKAKTTSLCLTFVLCLPFCVAAQQTTDASATAAYQQVRDVPFQRTLLTELPQEIPVTPHGNANSDAKVSLISPNSELKNATPIGYFASDTQEDAGESPKVANAATPMESAHVVVQPPLIQPYKNNQYSFVVENRGSLDAENVSIEISVDDSSRIVAMLPSDAVVTDEKALLTIKKLHAGEHYNVHLTATTSTEEPIVFQAKLVHTSVQKFGARHGTPQITVGSTRQHETTSARPFTMSNLPTNREVPIVSPEPEYEPRPDFQTNPYYQGKQGGKQLPVRGLYTTSPMPGNAPGGLSMTLDGKSMAKPKVKISASTIPSTPEDFTPLESEFSNMPSVTDDMDEDILLAEPTVESLAPINGPRNMDHLATREFALSISNPTAKQLKEVFVQLKVPEGFEIMTFDRQTWYDEISRTISFKVPAIAAGASEAVNYQLKATGTGFQIQKLLVEAEGLDRTEIRFDTFIQE